MLKIKNGNIFINRGQSAAIGLEIWNEDGTPFILPFGSGIASLKAYAACESIAGSYTYIFHNPIKDGIFEFSKTGKIDFHLYGDTTVTQDSSSRCEIDGIVTKITSSVPLSSITFGVPQAPIKILADSDEASVVVFSVYAGSDNSVVLRKILNMNSYMMSDNNTDYSAGGWNKFTSTEVIVADDLNEALQSAVNNGESIVVKLSDTDNYYQYINTKNGPALAPYSFAFTIPLNSGDTESLPARNYTYDVVAYKGTAAGALFENDELLFRKGYWKKELVKPHIFTIGDSQYA